MRDSHDPAGGVSGRLARRAAPFVAAAAMTALLFAAPLAAHAHDECGGRAGSRACAPTRAYGSTSRYRGGFGRTYYPSGWRGRFGRRNGGWDETTYYRRSRYGGFLVPVTRSTERAIFHPYGGFPGACAPPYASVLLSRRVPWIVPADDFDTFDDDATETNDANAANDGREDDTSLAGLRFEYAKVPERAVAAPPTAPPLVASPAAHLRAGRADAAEAGFLERTHADANDADAWLGLAHARFSRNRVPEARAALSEAVRSGAWTPASRLDVAATFGDAAAFRRRLAGLDAYTRWSPEDRDARLVLAYYETVLGRTSDAALDANAVLRVAPTDALARALLGLPPAEEPAALAPDAPDATPPTPSVADPAPRTPVAARTTPTVQPTVAPATTTVDRSAGRSADPAAVPARNAR